MDVTTVLLTLAAFVILALIGAAVFLIIQKRNIERAAVARADELVAENSEEAPRFSKVSSIKKDDLEEESEKAA